MHDILVIGGGPAGLTAALYAARAGKSVLVLEKEGFGGQIARSPRVENYPGLAPLSGVELVDAMVEQAIAAGAEMLPETVTGIARQEDHYLVLGEDDAYPARTVIVAVGLTHRRLDVPGDELPGVSYCAVCDGAFYRGADAAVVGGGSAALQEAIYLSDICRKVYLVHRRDSFRGEESLAAEVRSRGNVELLLNSRVTRLEGEDELEAMILAAPEGEKRVEVSGVFVALGQVPNSAGLDVQLPRTDQGFVLAGEDCTIGRGIFVAGDCRYKQVRQLTTAVADGSAAALAACRYLQGDE